MKKNKLGIYYLVLDKKIVYIGKSTNIKSRLADHLSDENKIFDTAIAAYIENKSNVDILEAVLIDIHKPEYNKYLKNIQTTTIRLDKDPIRYFDRVDVLKVTNNKYRDVANNYYDHEDQKLIIELQIKIETIENFCPNNLIRAIEKI